MKSAVALGAVAAVFLVGTVVGAMGMHLFEQYHGGAHAAHRDAHASLAATLHLTHDQRVEVERILDESRHETHALHERLMPQVAEHLDRVHDRIRQVLTSEQQKTFAELLEREDRRMQHLLLTNPSHDETSEHD